MFVFFLLVTFFIVDVPYLFCSKQYTAKYGPKPTQPPSSELTTRELDIDAELFERDFADDSDLLERDFDDSDLLERDFEELEARESIWTKIR